jgi:hypothetical protein
MSRECGEERIRNYELRIKNEKKSISNTQQGTFNDEGKQITQLRIGNTWMLDIPCWILDIHVVSS